MTRILLLDDHGIVREGIKHLLVLQADFEVCGECETPQQALQLITQLQPDFLITDLSLANSSGFSVIEQLEQHPHKPKIIVLSMHDNPALVTKATALGADAYVTKALAAKELIPALRAVMDGQSFVSSDIRVQKKIAAPKLSDRELVTLKLMLKGLAPKAIASDLGISDKTVYSHRANLMLKLQARNLTELQEKAVRYGLI
ncbi:MAG: response regulator transcription factor [Arenimonas sp.]|nr:response regulator transcription factor [Arenimonas sp.]MBP6310129.1 response regulator transcription factor [Arenimonas sp.]